MPDPFGHGVIESFLSADVFAVPVIELSVRAVDMNVPSCLDVPVALDRAGLLPPGELRCFLRRDGYIQRSTKSWSDMLYAGDQRIAVVPGVQNALP